MKLIIILLVLISSQNIVFAQEKLKIGDKAPFINIEDYLENKPLETELNNKYILLEFWATWCRPCLDEVPKINELVDSHKNRKDVLFISITDENPKKTKSTLKKIKFKSIVVSDNTSKTHKNFIMDNDGGYSIPKTVLIDSNGIVRWFGITMKLNNKLFEKFLANKEITESDETPFDIPSPIFTK